MKNYKKGLLTLMVLSAMSLMAAEDTFIYVTTFDDEDGENLNQCSLREAIKTAADNKAYGGCNAGDTRLGQKDRIQLKEGTYTLKRELVPQSVLEIYGAEPLDYSSKHVLTHTYPATTALKTTISGENQTRIFNSSLSKYGTSFKNIILANGSSTGLGGAIYAGADINLNNVAIVNSHAAQGGAIYLDGDISLNIDHGLIQANLAAQGSVLAMTCQNNLLFTKPTITIQNSSIVGNGATNNASMLEICGEASTVLQTNTIAKNQANTSTGAIIKSISSNTAQPNLSENSTLVLLSNTIVENSAASTLLYDQLGSKNLSFNVLAYNAGQSCRYALNNGNVADTKLDIVAMNNALQLSAVTGQCNLPKIAYESNTSGSNTNIDVSNISMSTLLTAYTGPSASTEYLPLYYPRDNQTANDLVNIGAIGCSDVDQRGFSRITDATLILNPSMKNTCDIGSVELMRLTAADIINLKNLSYSQMMDGYQQAIDLYQARIDDQSTDAKYLTQYQAELTAFKDLKRNTEKYAKYRAIYIDPFALALPDEQWMNNQSQVQALNAENYNISTQVLGVGTYSGEGSSFQFIGDQDPNLKCEWIPELKRIMFYRLDDNLSTIGENALCTYSITSKTDATKTTTGLLSASFANIAPIAKDDTYRLEYGTNQNISLHPLENDFDDDGPKASIAGLNKADFYHNEAGQELAIRLDSLPSAMMVDPSVPNGPCPGSAMRDTCYSSNLVVQVKNNYSPFDQVMEYTVFDAEGLASNRAKIYLNNTAKNTVTSGGGGGSMGWFSLLGLLGLAGNRYQRRGKKA